MIALFVPITVVGVEHEELNFNSYYSSVQNVTHNNSGLYRPYQTVTINNNVDEWPFVNGGGSAGEVGNRNALGNSVNFVETPPLPPPAWPHQSTYYPHFTNVNFWPHLYFQQPNFQSHATHQYSLPSVSAIDNSNGSSAYEIDIEGLSADDSHATPSTPVSVPQPTHQSDPIVSPSVQPSPQQISGVPNVILQPPQFPIRPIPQFQVAHQCPACFRYCISAGGLKRHSKFCRASQSNLDDIFASLEQPKQRDEPATSTPIPADSGPINLSTWGKYS